MYSKHQLPDKPAMSRSIQEEDGVSLLDSPFVVHATSLPYATRIWERHGLQNAIPRVYESKHRNNYCLEYEEYKRIMFNLQKMYPKSPIAELEFEDWVDMRLERVEDEKKILQLKIDAAVERSMLKGDSDHAEIKNILPAENLPVVDWKTETFPKIKPCHKMFLPAIDFGSTKPSFVSSFSSEKYRGQQARAGCWHTETDHDGHENVSLSSSVPTLSESFSAFGSSLDSSSQSPVSSANFRTAQHFDYRYNCVANTQSRLCSDKWAADSSTSIGCDIALQLDFMCIDGESKSAIETKDDDEDEDDDECSGISLALQILHV
jgi:hypothetical protein